MTLNDVLPKLREERLFPILVEAIPEHGDDLEFVGSLNEYIEAAKALQATVIFVSTLTLSKEGFCWHSPEADDDETDPEDPVDLCVVVPDLKDYMNRIGQHGRIELSIPLRKGSLKMAMVEDWMDAFIELRFQAQKLLQQAFLEKQAQEEETEEAGRQHLLGNLRGLISDEGFVRLPTQKAMLAYALDDFPELEILGENLLKKEIQNLKARIDAQGLCRK